jgi:hypothetical protein
MSIVVCGPRSVSKKRLVPYLSNSTYTKTAIMIQLSTCFFLFHALFAMVAMAANIGIVKFGYSAFLK